MSEPYDDAHFGVDAVQSVAQRVVLHRGLHEDRVRDDQVFFVQAAGDRRTNAELTDRHDPALDLEDVAGLDRSLEQQDDAGHEVLRDRLHRETDGDGEHGAGREQRSELRRRAC